MLLNLDRPTCPFNSTIVMQFLANFDPLLLSHFVTYPGTPPKVRHTYISDPPIFSRPRSTKIPDKSPLYKFYLNCSRRFLSGVLSRLVFVRSPFCHTTGS